MAEHMTTPELIRALGGADAICQPGCTCRGSYAGPERRAAHRDPGICWECGEGYPAEQLDPSGRCDECRP